MSFEIQDFESEVVARSYDVPVVVDFWAPWCAPCTLLEPSLKQLCREDNQTWDLTMVNVDEHKTIVARYKISGIPNVKLFSGGSVIDEFTGALPPNRIRQWLDRALPNQVDQKIKAIDQMLKSGQKRAAQEMLDSILREHPDNAHALVTLAATLVTTNPQQALALVKRIDRPGEFADDARAIQTISRTVIKAHHAEQLTNSPVKGIYLQAVDALENEQYGLALDLFIKVMREDRLYDYDGAKRACIALFKILGEENQITKTHRRAFSSALYV